MTMRLYDLYGQENYFVCDRMTEASRNVPFSPPDIVTIEINYLYQEG